MSAIRTYGFILFIFLTGLGISLAINVIVKSSQQSRDEQYFIEIANERFVSFNRALENELSFVHYLGNIFQSRNIISREEFQLLTQELLKSHPEIDAMQWIPQVRRDEIIAYESRAIFDGLVDFKIQINHYSQDVEPESNYIYPIYYSEPSIFTEHLLGNDLALDLNLRNTFDIAFKDAIVAISDPFILEGDHSQMAIRAVYPIYKSNKNLNSGNRNTDNLLGFVVMVLKLSEFFDYAISDAFEEGELQFSLQDVDKDVFMAGIDYNDDIKDEDFFYHEEIIDTGRGLDISVEYEGRLWRLLAMAPKTFSTKQNWLSQNVNFVLGISITLFVVLALFNQKRKTLLIKTEVEERTKELALSEALSRNVLDTAVDAIISINELGIISRFNDASVRMFGYSVDEAIGQNITLLIPNSVAVQHDDYLKKYLETNESQIIGTSREVMARRKDGSFIPVNLAVSDTRIKGKFRFTGILHDLSEIKKIEQDLMDAKEKSEAATQAKSIFLANMSHEIRTPLNAIIGFTHILQHQQVDDEQLRLDKLTKISSSAQHLLGIINDILDFSKIEANKLSVEMTELNLPKVFSHVRNLIDNKAQEKGLSIIVDIDPRIPEWFLGDPLRIGQILLNYANNAVKFTEKGSVTLKAVLVTENEQDKLITINFEVIDTGIGLSKEQQDRLFNAFEQADDSTTRQFGGTGLGLVISKRLARLMNGNVGVRSNQGEGSLFWFTGEFKLIDNSKQGKAKTKISEINQDINHQPDFESITIDEEDFLLIVEDNKTNQEVISDLLSSLNISIKIANNGQEALDIVANEVPILILMDMQMPVMDGIEATKQIRQIKALDNVPIIAMTANAFVEDKQACIDAGMNEHLSKPVEPNNFYQLLQSYLGTKGLNSDEDDSRLEQSVLIADYPEECPVDLQNIEIIDIKSALVYFNGNCEKLLFELHRFVNYHANDASAIKSIIESPIENDEAILITHTLKGLTSTLGLNSVNDLCQDIEKKLRVGEDVSGLIDTLEKEHLEVITALKTNLPKINSTVSDEIDEEKVLEIIATMTEMLENDDYNSIDFVSKNQKYLVHFLQDDFIHFEQLVINYDTEEALELLNNKI